MSETLKNQIQEEIKANSIMMYIKGEKDIPMCGFSATVLDLFKKLEVPFESQNVLNSLPEYRQALKSITDWHTTPQIFIQGEFIGGCDIAVEMYNSGELQKMVATLQEK